ncbi:hypothetical protein ABPG72_013984 [Tetrahymena utriculariae]
MGNCTEMFNKRKNHNQSRICPSCNQNIPGTNDFNQHFAECQRNRNPIQHAPNQNNNRNLNHSVSNNNDSIQQEGQNQFPNPSLINNNPNQRPSHQPQNRNTHQHHQNRGLRQNFVWTKVYDEKDKTKYTWKQIEVGLIVEQELIKQLPNADIKNFSFEEKQIWFRYKLEQLRIPWTEGAHWMEIHTDNVLLTSLTAIDLVDLHKEVKISINGDKVQDAGGLLREWTHMITKEIFDKNTGLFCLADSEEITYKINQDADKCDHIMNCFRLFGKVIGKAIFERIPLEAYVDKTIVKQLISQPVTLDDIFSYDQQLYKSWLYIKNNTLKDDDFIGYMSFQRKTPQGIIDIDLIENGQKVEINEKNKHQYIDLCIQYISYKQVKDFIENIQAGLYSVIPKNLLEIFDANEFEMILNGLPFINVEDWEQNSIYKNGYTKTHHLIQEFWRILRSFDQQKLEKFLHFCTGSSRTSVEGFKKLESNRGNYAKFCIEQVKYDQSNPYPKAHTCFNRLELPLYPTKELLNKYLQIIVNNDLDGIFGMEQTACLNHIKG